MPEIDPKVRDPLDDFERREITLLGKTKRVYVAGNGPAVIVTDANALIPALET